MKGPHAMEHHANSAMLNQRFVKGVWQSSLFNKKVIDAVACPRPQCRAAKGWPCTTESGKDSSTLHSARWEAYRSL